MQKIHIAISTNDIEKTVKDYTQRLRCEPCLVVEEQYALWRTDTVNFSVRYDASCSKGSLRHFGWEDPKVTQFSEETDVNGIVWERFNASNQADEINEIWPHVNYSIG
jgi:hypothetical protein